MTREQRDLIRRERDRLARLRVMGPPSAYHDHGGSELPWPPGARSLREDKPPWASTWAEAIVTDDQIASSATNFGRLIAMNPKSPMPTVLHGRREDRAALRGGGRR